METLQDYVDRAGLGERYDKDTLDGYVEVFTDYAEQNEVDPECISGG